MVQKCVVYEKIRNMSEESVLTVLYPTRSEISQFWYTKTQGQKIAMESFVLLFLSSVHCRYFIKQLKKSVIYTLSYLHVKNSQILCYLTIRPVALLGYGSIAHEVKPNGLLTCGP